MDFVTVTKKVTEGKMIYGEMTKSPAPVDELYQFFTIEPRTDSSCLLKTEVYIRARSVFKKLLIGLVVKRALKKNISKSLDDLGTFIASQK